MSIRNNYPKRMASEMFYIRNHLIGARLAGAENDPAPLGTYVLSRDRVFLEADRIEFRAKVPVSMVSPPLSALTVDLPNFQWKIPKPPAAILYREILPFFMMINELSENNQMEALVNVVWRDSSWRVVFPTQTVSDSYVSSKQPLPDGTVLQIHSHGGHKPFWSLTDDSDEIGFLVYGVIGKLGSDQVEMLFRVGNGGHWLLIGCDDVFSGC